MQRVRNGWAPEIKRLNDNLEKLEESLTGTDECVLDIYCLEETLQDKITILAAELTSVKTDIADLKDHLTSVIKELNAITDGGIEKKLLWYCSGRDFRPEDFRTFWRLSRHLERSYKRSSGLSLSLMNCSVVVPS